jgi:hypothetical protein
MPAGGGPDRLTVDADGVSITSSPPAELLDRAACMQPAILAEPGAGIAQSALCRL